MKLYNYFRSSASFRVRIALNLKGLAYDYVPVHLAKGEHKLDAYAAVSADRLVPMLELDDGTRLSQSMAIIEFLDETQPGPALLPADALGKARVRALAQSIACEIHPLNNLRVLKYLGKDLGLSPKLVEDIITIIARINAERGTSMLLVEQNATVALAVAHSGYIMENGKIVIDGSAERLANDPDVREFYLGMGGGGEAKSFKDIKHYKRRKRWLS